MTDEKDEALRLADGLERLVIAVPFEQGSRDEDLEAAAMLRSQHARIQELEAELAEQCRINAMGAERELSALNRVRELEAVARVALEALECISEHGHRCNRCDSEVDEGGKLATALRKTLGEA